ncbi:bile acid:sodium symporter family protein [Mobiluncus curtisii]|uniref:bile acid:sodium symporter family protein n=1 Tax=Mobiluncus curtisii TaxID=2051 RepID=UPI00242F9948|nr:bile acid:sodium symporter family protein [Mobiluncus curtisii]
MTTQTNTRTDNQSAAPKALTPEDRSALKAVTIFPVLIIAAALWGFFSPATAGMLTPHVAILLGVIMFGMGLTLTLPDFRLVFTRPWPILLGVVAQYVIMPALAVLIVTVLRLPDAVAVGVILVGCAPGGTSSNVISYLAKADVALSVTMTAISTLLAPVMTPLLTQWLAGKYMPLDAGAMAVSIVKMVLVPVVAGLVLRLAFPKFINRILPALPWISTLGISAVLAGVVSASVDAIKATGLLVLVAVILHNMLGYGVGYGFSKLLRADNRVSRTVSIEVGMQNSGMAATLAKTHFAMTPEAALPGAIFSIWHNLSGALLSVIYRRMAEREAARNAETSTNKSSQPEKEVTTAPVSVG